MKWLTLILPLVFVASCATKAPAPALSVKLIPESEYQQIIKQNSRQEQVYSGLYNSIDMTGVIINTAVTDAQMDQMARIYLWDDNKYTQEKIKSDEKLRKESEIFVSFFTPERKHDDLHKNKTLWKIFLDVDGKRLEGKATKIKLLVEEIQRIYPFHNRFSTPYTLTFPIPMKQIETAGSIKLTITGPVGSTTVDFANAQK